MVYPKTETSLNHASRARCLTALFAALFFAAPAHATTDEDIFRNFQFNFINPGGRSLGMGGAFISLADDATAAQANPAGLTTLLSSQIFFEARFADPEFASIEIGFQNTAMESIALEVETEPELVVSPSFVSYVRPWNRLAFGVSRQELLNVQNQPEASYEFESVAGNDTRESVGDIELLLVNWNASWRSRFMRTLGWVSRRPTEFSICRRRSRTSTPTRRPTGI